MKPEAASAARQALFQNGISIPNLVLTLGIYNLSMGAIFFFLFTAFEAFTAKGDLYASMINDAILLITVYISYYVAVVEGDANDLNYRYLNPYTLHPDAVFM